MYRNRKTYLKSIPRKAICNGTLLVETYLTPSTSSLSCCLTTSSVLL